MKASLVHRDADAGGPDVARSARPGLQADSAIDTRTYDWKVFDKSGWIYLLPPLRGRRLLCLDPVGNIAHRLASEGAEVTVVVAPGQPPWAAEFTEASKRPTIGRLRLARAEDVGGAWPDRALHDGFIVHDLEGSILRARHVPSLARMLRVLTQHLGADAFVYLGAQRLWSPWRLTGRTAKDAGAAGGRGVSRSRLLDLVRAAGAQAWQEHPFLLSGSQLVEVLGPRGYRSIKNRTLPAERAKEILLGPALSRHLSPGLGIVGYRGEPRASVIDLVRSRVGGFHGAGLAPAQQHPSVPVQVPPTAPTTAPAPALLHCLVLHAGKIVLGLEPSPLSDSPPMTVIVTGEAVAIRRREAEEISLTGLAAALPQGLATLVPQWLGRFDVEGAQAFVQSTRPGVTCDVDVPFLSTVTRAAAACLADLHRHTRDRSQPLRPATLMSSLCIAASERIPGLSGSLSALREAIEESAAKLDFPMVWMHGDFKIENVMYDPGSGALTGVIDWELSMPAGLPLLDLLYLCTFNRMIRGQNRLDAFRALSLGEGLEDEEREMISDYLGRLGIHDAQRLPLGIAFVCHDIGCRIQWDVVPADALRQASRFLDELRARLLSWQGTPRS